MKFSRFLAFLTLIVGIALIVIGFQSWNYFVIYGGCFVAVSSAVIWYDKKK
jgi:hypothetical protein